jgi:uncharacterized protein YjaZ
MKKRRLFLLPVLLYATTAAQGQTHPPYGRLADSLYKVKNYKLAAATYLLAASGSDFKAQKSGSQYNAACSYALDSNKSEAISLLTAAISNGYDNKQNLLKDTDFAIIRKDSIAWNKIISLLKDPPPPNINPLKAVFHTEDLHNFWTAYEKFIKDTANAIDIFKKEYFNKASAGMDDYMAFKVPGIAYFIKHIKERPKFYKALKPNTAQVDSYRKDFYQSFSNFKKIYSKAVFPDVYFVIGAFTSGGTVSKKGLLLGTNQMSKTPNIPTDELTLWQKNNFTNLTGIKNTVAHELIHFQQDGMKQDTTTLCYSIQEGMADFIGELISGKNANERIHVWAKGREKKIWDRFKVDIYYDRYSNWIGNGDQETIDNPADQGYWVGYQICKSYYENAKNKIKAIDEMLHIQDYKAFFIESKWEEKIANIK